MVWPFTPRLTLDAPARASALARCDVQRRALAACIAANGAVADRACSSLESTWCECVGLKAAPIQAAAFGECVASGHVDCGKELTALRSALKAAGLYPPPPLTPKRRRG